VLALLDKSTGILLEKFYSGVQVSLQVILLATVSFLCVVVVMLVLNNTTECKDFSCFKDLSGWAQAIGGFLAIGAAFLVGNSQAAAAIVAVERSAQLEHVRKCNALLSVAEELERVSERAFRVHESKQTMTIDILRIEWELRLDILLDELRRVGAIEFGDQEVLSSVIGLKVASAYLKNALEKMPAALKAAIEDENGNENQFNHVLSVININRIEIAKESKRLKERFKNKAVAKS
jgi:hypothetical protein